MTDPEIRIRRGGGLPDSEIRRGKPGFQKKVFSALRASVWSKNKGWGGGGGFGGAAGPSLRSATDLNPASTNPAQHPTSFASYFLMF